MKTVILGKESNLTNFLVKEFDNAEVISFRELKKNINSIDKLFIEKKKYKYNYKWFLSSKQTF